METVFLKLVNLSITASWLVLAVLLMRLVFRKAPRWVFCLLWGLVALRLICPISIESTFSLIPSAEPLPQDIIYTAAPKIQSGVGVLDDFVNPVLSNSLSPAVGSSANPTQIWSFILARIWAAGVAAMLLYALISYLFLRRRVATATLLRENIKQSESVDSPFVLGLFRPVIYLPYCVAEVDFDYVIAHEQAHIRRKDHWWKPLGFILLAIYWFHPLLWVAYMLLCQDVEAACDEKVIREMTKEERRAYSAALLRCSTRRRAIAACPLEFGETGVRDRIKAVMNYKKPKFWIVLTAVAATIVAAVCLLTVPKRDSYNITNALSVASEEELPGTAYVSWQCLYMNPFSSYISDDSGCRYEIGKDSFSIISLRGGTAGSKVSAGREVDYAGRPVTATVPVSKWEWQEFPYTDEEWEALFKPISSTSMADIHTLYERILYQPLDDLNFLLLADGDLLIVTLKEDTWVGTYIWSVYSLVNEVNMGVAQWEYAPMLSSRLPAFRFTFDMESVEILASCTEGKLVDFDSQSASQAAPSDTVLNFPKGNALYWSPLKETDETGQAFGTAINFYCTRENGSQLSGTIYITAGGSSDDRTIYTATLVGAGLHLSPNVETEGGVIALLTTDAELGVTEYDLRDGEPELSPVELSQYVFFTNSTEMVVTVKGDDDFDGTIILRDISQNNAEIGRKDVSSKDRKVIFTNLTSARLYRIECDNMENCTVVVSSFQ